MHLILDHFEDYFDLTGEALGNTSDQLVEAMHQYKDVMLKKSGYWIKDFSSEYCASQQHKGILRINGYYCTTAHKNKTC